jgi:dethiobiotin synthetase
MMAPGFFITGTDTGVGKTWFSSRVLESVAQSGRSFIGLKPVECGGQDDAKALQKACGEKAAKLEEINHLHFPEPLSPAAVADRTIDLDALVRHVQSLALRYDCTIVEGAGGWLMPLDARRTMADLAVAIGYPVIVVAANRLGVLNHVLLTVAAIQSSGCRCAGIYLNDLEGADPQDLSRISNLETLRRICPDLVIGQGDPGEFLEAL